LARPTILIADDHPILLEGLERLLAPEGNLLLSVRNGLDLLEAAQRLRPDVIVTDVSMPSLSGIEVARQLRGRGARCHILVLSMHEDKEIALDAMRAGARAYVLKTAVCDELVTALRHVNAGRIYVSAAISKGETFEFEQAHKKQESSSDSLTAREREVLHLVAEGKSAKEVAALLNMAIRTVFFHKTNLKAKLGLQTTAELTQYAVKHRMITP
jgi:DNA-binding NarL/FixJ family response regulator